MTALGLPFAHLNLRWNPFGEPPLPARSRLAVVDLPEMRPWDVVQIVGDSGRGKTTHLLALHAQHPGSVYVRMHEGEDRWRGPVPTRGVFLLGEAQRLRAGDLRRLLAAGLSVGLGTHDDLSPAAGRPLRTVRADVMDTARLRAIVNRRLEWARRGPGPVPAVPDAVLTLLVARHGTDVRAIEGVLYDAVQRLEEPGNVEV
jgi:hypothetical protein